MLAREMDERPPAGNSQGAPKKKMMENRITVIQIIRRLRYGWRGGAGEKLLRLGLWAVWSMVGIR
jgi:hypothetical protein